MMKKYGNGSIIIWLVLVAFGFDITAIGGYWLACAYLSLSEYVEIVKIALLILGGTGGIYGLILGTKRTKNAQTHLFNERLGRGVELLANQDAALRAAGVEVLYNLAESANEDEVKLIVDILHRYLNTKAKIKRNKRKETMPKKPKPYEERGDIELCVKTIFKYAKKLGMKSSKMSFINLDLRGLDFSETEFNGIQFEDTDLSEAHFVSANLTKIHFSKTILKSVSFSRANLNNAYFDLTNLNGAKFEGADLTSAELLRVKKLTQKQLNTIIFKEGESPELNTPKKLIVPKYRAYTFKNNSEKRFVKSSKNWSEQDVHNFLNYSFSEMPGKIKPQSGKRV